jgi:hypothetical protein
MGTGSYFAGVRRPVGGVDHLKRDAAGTPVGELWKRRRVQNLAAERR